MGVKRGRFREDQSVVPLPSVVLLLRLPRWSEKSEDRPHAAFRSFSPNRMTLSAPCSF